MDYDVGSLDLRVQRIINFEVPVEDIAYLDLATILKAALPLGETTASDVVSQVLARLKKYKDLDDKVANIKPSKFTHQSASKSHFMAVAPELVVYLNRGKENQYDAHALPPSIDVLLLVGSGNGVGVKPGDV